MGYLELDGVTVVQESKGYICPLGQICTVCMGFSLFLRERLRSLFFGREIWKWDE
jgi:hypothetical protein